MRKPLLALLSCLWIACASDEGARIAAHSGLRIAPATARSGQELHAAGIQAIADAGAPLALPNADDTTLRWLINGHVVGSGPTLAAQGFHRGDVIELQRVRRSAGGAIQVVERDQKVIRNSPPVVHAVTLTRSRENGLCLQAEALCSDADDDPLRLRYEWSIDGKPIEGAMDELASLQAVEKGSRVRVRITASDGDLDSEPLVSEPYLVDNLPPSLQLSGQPVIQELANDSRKIVFQLLALDPDEDPLTVELLGAPRGARYDALHGTVAWTVKGAIPPTNVLVRVSDDKGASIEQWLRFEGEAPAGR